MTGQPAARRAPPPRSSLPDMPRSWYFIDRTAAIGRKPVAIRLGAKDLVAYRRGSDRAIAVLSGRCPHCGADLSNGSVVGDRLRCPFHAWEFESTGACAVASDCERPPEFTRLAPFHTGTRYGMGFFFHGAPGDHEPLFKLPRSWKTTNTGHRGNTSRPTPRATSSRSRGTWSRPTRSTPRISAMSTGDAPSASRPWIIPRPTPAASATASRCRARTRSVAARALLGREVQGSFTTWYGNYIFARSRFGGISHDFMIAVRPLGPDRTLLQFVALMPAGWVSPLRNPVLTPLQLAARQWLRSAASCSPYS